MLWLSVASTLRRSGMVPCPGLRPKGRCLRTPPGGDSGGDLRFTSPGLRPMARCLRTPAGGDSGCRAPDCDQWHAVFGPLPAVTAGQSLRPGYRQGVVAGNPHITRAWGARHVTHNMRLLLALVVPPHFRR